MKKENRKRTKVMNVYLTDEEYNSIISSSSQAGLTISTFARNVCTGYRIESKSDQQTRTDLRKLNADLGRIGGLLKLALSENKDMQEARRLLVQIERLKDDIKHKIKIL